MDSSLNKFRDKFYEEANQLLDKVENDLLELEKMPNENELIESAFRAMHTIKGVSGMFGFDFVCEFTHCMESVFQLIKDKEIAFNREIFDLTFSSLDHVRKLIADEKLADPQNQQTHSRLIKEISVILEKGKSSSKLPSGVAEYEIITPAEENKDNTWHILLKTDEKLYFRGISLVGIFDELSQIGSYEISKLDYLTEDDSDAWSIILSSDASKGDIEDIFMFIEDNTTITRLANKNILEGEIPGVESKIEHENEHEQSILDFVEKGSKPKPAKEEDLNLRLFQKNTETISSASKQTTKRISVDSTKLDNLMFLVSELITVDSQLLLATHNEQFSTIKPLIEKIDSLSKLFRNNAFEIRLVPLSDTILRFQRLIRDLSRQLGKKIELVTQGTDTELDKNTIDQLNEPLMHIIRNCIDHGIEDPEKRAESGKPETGTIKISANQSGNYVIICVEDDGLGINLEKVRLKAIDRGLIKSTDKPTKEEIFDLIFLPGFSTAESLTEVSGRGVGMDVVRKKVIDLRGDIMVQSEEGQGTSFTLRLQQSVAIIDSLLFTVEDSFFTVPLSDIMICSQAAAEEIAIRSHTATIPFNNQLIPFVDLRKKLNIGGSYSNKVKVVIIKNNENLVALLTDKIVGEHQAVLKPLGKAFRNQEYITSASQLGDGNLAFMIDTNKLFKSQEMMKQKTVSL